MNLNSNKNVILIFAGLMGLTLIAFQNCSSSLFVLGTAKPVDASQLSDMLKESEKEVKKTQKELETVSVPLKIKNRLRDVAGDSDDSEELGEEPPASKKGMKVKLRMKKIKKKKSVR